MTLASQREKLNRLLELSDDPVFDGLPNFHADTARAAAAVEGISNVCLAAVARYKAASMLDIAHRA